MSIFGCCSFFPADVEHTEEIPCIQEDQDPEPLHVKEEQKELLAGCEDKKLYLMEEVKITMYPITAVPVKSEDDEEEKSKFSQLHQDNVDTKPPPSVPAEQKTDREDCGGLEPGKNTDLNSHLQPHNAGTVSIDDKYEDDDDVGDWQEPLSDSEPETEENG